MKSAWHLSRVNSCDKTDEALFSSDLLLALTLKASPTPKTQG